MSANLATMEQQWQQVLARDAHADGKFVYAVKSTHIYCRPTCPSRRPRRANVNFYSLPAEAESAGFRPCKRCRPNSANSQVAIVDEACKFIDGHLDTRVTLSLLAKHLGYSPFYLQRLFKKTLGITPQQYQAARRLSAFKTNLRSAPKVVDAAYNSGYSSSSRVHENATDLMGMTPASYGKNGKGAKIVFTIFDSQLGNILLAATERGICSLRFGASYGELERQVRAEFSAAKIRRDGLALVSHVKAVQDCAAGCPAAVRLPLDVRATAFQRLVWSALRQIPVGTVQHYQEVSKTIGRPRAHRAVARACAANNVALLIPCHRVVPKSGGDGGYRWGTERKAALLQSERKRVRS